MLFTWRNHVYECTRRTREHPNCAPCSNMHVQTVSHDLKTRRRGIHWTLYEAQLLFSVRIKRIQNLVHYCFKIVKWIWFTQIALHTNLSFQHIVHMPLHQYCTYWVLFPQCHSSMSTSIFNSLLYFECLSKENQHISFQHLSGVYIFKHINKHFTWKKT